MEGQIIEKQADDYKVTIQRLNSARKYVIKTIKSKKGMIEPLIKYTYIYDDDSGITSISTPMLRELSRCEGRFTFDDIKGLVGKRPTSVPPDFF